MDWNKLNNDLSVAVLNAGQLEDLLSELGCSLRGYPTQTVYRAPCPIHGGDGPNFQVGVDGAVLPVWWRCHSQHCERRYKPSLLGLVRGLLSVRDGKDVSLKAAAAFLAAFVGQSLPTTSWPRSRPRPRPRAKPLTLTRAQVRQRLEIPSPFFLSRGFSCQILDRMDIGHSHKLGRTVVPLYDDTGETCVGFVTRSEKPACIVCKRHHAPGDCGAGEPRWRNMDGLAKGACLFGYAAAQRADAPVVLLVEGVPDALRVMDAGLPAVALLGTDLSAQQAQKLAALRKTVLVALDNDNAGRIARSAVFGQLLKMAAQARMFPVPDHRKDAGDLTLAEAKRWLARLAA